MRRAVALVAAGCLGVSGLAGANAANAAAAPRITWGECTDPDLAASRAECGMLSVPLDHSKPNGTTIKIAVSRMRATVPASRRQGVMLVNPGGPGGSGLGFAALRDAVPHGAGQYYDWIGFDPRGVGASKPAMSCIANYSKGPRPSYAPASRTAGLSPEETKWLARSKAYAAACGKKYASLLPHMHTTDTVKDMDLLRVALGAKKINYYGFSYGTYLGQVYSTLYPTHVRRMVLDGNVDPRGIWYAAQLSQDRSFEKVIEQFFAWVAKYNGAYHLGTTATAVRRQYNVQLTTLRTKPVQGIGASEWADAFSHAAYAESLWPSTASAFASRVNDGNMDAMSAQYERAEKPGDDNGFAVYNAVQCVDAAWPKSYRKGWRDDSFTTAATAPFLTWANVWFNTSCIYWPTASGNPVKVNGAKIGSVLMVNSTADGATPYSGALEVRKRFPHASLIAEQGATTHANSLGGNGCIDNKIAAYLATGALPARRAGNHADVVCKRLPLPEPNPFEFTQAQAPGSATSSASEPAPTPTPPVDQSVVDKIIGLLPDRGRL